MLHLSDMSFLEWNHPSGLGSKDSSLTVKAKKFWRGCTVTEPPGILRPANSITLELEIRASIELALDGPLLVPELCSAMFGLGAGALGGGCDRGREPELV